MSAWLLPVVICAPLAVVGMAGLVLSPENWIYVVVLFALVIVVVGYNSTVRLAIDDQDVKLRRYGRVVWSVPRRGTQIKDGLAGNVPFIPALILWRNEKKAGYVLKGWFEETVLTELRAAVAA